MNRVMCMWLIQLITEYRYSPMMVLTYQIGEDLEQAMVPLTSLPGIAVDPSSGNVYVADTANNRIQVFSNDGIYISNWGKYGHSEVGMRFPADIVIDPSSDNMLVTDTGNSRILVFHSHSPISDEAFPSEEEEISGNDTGDQTPFSGFL